MRANESPKPTPHGRDCSGRLVAFGLLSVLLGAMGIFTGLSHLLLPLLHDLLPDPELVASDWRSAFMGLTLCSTAGAVMIWAGVGSMRMRRWVPPVMLVIAWTWLIAGLFGLLLVAGMLEEIMILANPAGDPWPPEIELIVESVLLGMLAVGGVLLPSLYLWAYRGRDVRSTCELLDPAPTWTDRCPMSVLGLSVALGLTALLMVSLALRPVVPVFGVLVTGPAGALLILLGAVASAFLAVGTYRLSMPAWWATSLALLALGASTAVTFQVVEPIELFRGLGYPEEHLEVLRSAGGAWRGPAVWGTVALTLGSLGYMLAVRKRFRDHT